MRILVVCSGNAPGFVFERHQAFIYEQVEAVKKQEPSIHFDYFFISQKGVRGYLSCLKKLKAQLSKYPYDFIHAHVATSAMLANMQRRVPVLATFHGSDINLKGHRLLSMVVEILSKSTIYVSEGLKKQAILRGAGKANVIPCGIDFNLFVPVQKEDARRLLGLSAQKKYIVFSSGFDNGVKNYPLAKAAIDTLLGWDVGLIELKNYSRQEVALLMAAVDVALMTSFTEGSPQFVKEALACNCPVVSTDVGDVRNWIENVDGCYLTTYEPADVATKLAKVLSRVKPIKGRSTIQELDNCLIAQKLLRVYQAVSNPQRAGVLTTNT